MDYERIMFFGAHPDDELIMAGTLAKLADSGVRVVVVQMTDGCEGYPSPDMRNTIVALRLEESVAADAALGISRRIHIGRPDMALVNDKETLRACIAAIREERPDAIFTHGPDDPHRDHVGTHHLAIEARFHAAEPVSTELGEAWFARHLLFDRAVRAPLPRVRFDVTGYAHKRLEAIVTQTSQLVLFEQHWGKTKDDFLAEAAEIKERRAPAFETFWIAGEVQLTDFPPRGL